MADERLAGLGERIPRALRWTSVQPASRSSAAICWEMAHCVNESDSAAAD